MLDSKIVFSQFRAHLKTIPVLLLNEWVLIKENRLLGVALSSPVTKLLGKNLLPVEGEGRRNPDCKGA